MIVTVRFEWSWYLKTYLQAQSREKLKHLQHTLSRLESSANAERMNKEMVEEEKDALDTSLRAEKTRCQSLQEQVESLQVGLSVHHLLPL